jgi:hypothetical protein
VTSDHVAQPATPMAWPNQFDLHTAEQLGELVAADLENK